MSYSDKIIRFKLIACLSCSDIKEDILRTDDKPLEETVRIIENKESGKLAKKTVGAASGHVVRVTTDQNGGGDARPCTHCDRKNHGSSKSEREKACPAFSKTYNTCGRTGHFSSVCKSKQKPHGPQNTSVKEVTADIEAETQQVSLGDVVGLMMTMAMVKKGLGRSKKKRVPQEKATCRCWRIQVAKHVVWDRDICTHLFSPRQI